MYAAACVLKHHEIEKINNPLNYRSETISKSKYSKLSKIRNHDPEGFAYVVSTIRLLDI